MNCQNCKKQIPRESVYCMFCGAPIFSADREEGRAVRVQPVRRTAAAETPRPAPRYREPLEQTPRFCGVCGASLPEGYESDVCDACLFVRDINANLPEELPLEPVRAAKNFHLDLDLDTEYGAMREPAKPARSEKRAAPTPPRSSGRKPAKWLLPTLAGIAAVIVLAVGALVVVQLRDNDGGGSGASVSEPSKDEAAVISYAQEMVKAAARDPKSVHFDRATVTVARDVSDYIIKQTFERADASGKLTPGSYEVVLELVPKDGKSYSPLLLKVDDETIYDYR